MVNREITPIIIYISCIKDLLAQVLGGELCPGDDINKTEWFPLTGLLPEMAFEADEDIIMRYSQTRISGAPVDMNVAIAKNKK